MTLQLITAPTIEPIDLATAKRHLRIDSEDIADDISTSISIAPGSHDVAASYTLAGSSVAVAGYEILVNLVAGDCSAGIVDVKLQHSNNGSTWTDVTGGAFTQVTASNDNAIQEKAYTSGYAYLRAVATVATAACEFSVEVIKDASTSVEDDDITGIITAARLACEKFQNRTYVTQTWELWLDGWPDKDYIELPLPPIQEPAVTAGSFVTGTIYRILTVGTTDFTLIGAASSTAGVIFTATGAGSGTGTATTSGIIKYYGTDNTVYYVDGSDLYFDIKSEPGRICLAYGEIWPSTTLRPHNINGRSPEYQECHAAYDWPSL
jgi:hypothetical protein